MFNTTRYTELQVKRRNNTLTERESFELQEMCKEKLFELMESPEVKGVFERLKNC